MMMQQGQMRGGMQQYYNVTVRYRQYDVRLRALALLAARPTRLPR